MPELPGLWSLSPLAGMIGMLVLLFLGLSTGRLITKSSHERELALANKRADEWRAAHARSEDARAVALEQNSALLAGVRIADKFYKDFLPPQPDERTIPKITGGHDAPLV